MSFNGTEGLPITLAEGHELTKRFRNNNPDQIIASFMGRDLILKLLEQKEVVGMRIYYGENTTGKLEPVLVGVDQFENDILELIIDTTLPCPPRCSIANPLNS